MAFITISLLPLLRFLRWWKLCLISSTLITIYIVLVMSFLIVCADVQIDLWLSSPVLCLCLCVWFVFLVLFYPGLHLSYYYYLDVLTLLFLSLLSFFLLYSFCHVSLLPLDTTNELFWQVTVTSPLVNLCGWFVTLWIFLLDLWWHLV